MNVTVRNYLKSCDKQVPTEGVVVVTGANTATPLAVGSVAVKFQKLWLYPAKANTSGLLTPNTGTVYAGKTPNNQPDALASNGGPIKYEYPLGQCGDLTQVNIQAANIGDGVFYTYT